MAPIPFDYRRQFPANILAAVFVEFLAMLAVETVLNRPHCSEFFTGLGFEDGPHRKVHGIQILSFLGL